MGSSPKLKVKRRTKGDYVIRWIERYCVFTNGKWIGQPMRLLPWEKRFILNAFELQYDSELRRYKWVFLGVPKKNGKTEIGAALGLFLLIGDGEPSPLVTCAASSDGQADLVFGAASTMCEMSEPLKQITEVYEKEILVPSLPGAKMNRVASRAGTNDGVNLHALIADELHEWTGPRGMDLFTVLTNGIIARDQPMVLMLSTAGYDPDSVCFEQFDYARKVQNGDIDDPSYYLEYHAPKDPDADYRDPKVWEEANPSYGVTVTKEALHEQLNKRSITESDFRRYFLNQWVESQATWLPQGAWSACQVDKITLDPELPIHVGIDASRRNDATTVSVAQDQGDRLVTMTRVWMNPFQPGDSREPLYQVPMDEVEQYCRDIAEKFPLPAVKDEAGRPIIGPAFNYDQMYFSRSADALEHEGLNMIEIPANKTRWIPISRTFYEQVVLGRIAHDGDQILAQHIRNVVRVEH